MTIFTQREASTHNGEPIECYEFVSSQASYFYTSYAQEVVMAGKTFTPIPLRRSSVRPGTHSEDNLELRVELPVTAPLVANYGFQNTAPSITLTVYRAHKGTNLATDYMVIWSGKVLGFSISGNVATLSIPSIFGIALQENIPTVCYQSPCAHVLYDDRCKASRAANMVSTFITSVNGSMLAVNSIGSFSDTDFIGGEILDNTHNEVRMVATQSRIPVFNTTILTVNYPFTFLGVNTPVTISRGCDHGYRSHCLTRFNNQANFGGCPFIPRMNPFVLKDLFSAVLSHWSNP